MSSSVAQEILDQLPEEVLKLLREWGIIPEDTDIGSPYTPEWGRQWSGFGWAGFIAPASLAPYYAWSMVQRAYRAGYIPNDWAAQPEGGPGLYTFAGRQQQAEGQVIQYLLQDYIPSDEGPGYNQSQATLWAARASYWNLQQSFTPLAESWAATKLLSYLSPEAFSVRAIGFPFYGGIQTMLAGYAEAPYVQTALALNSNALKGMQQSSIFFPGQYPTLSEELVGGVGEWTLAQMIGWAAMSPSGQRMSSLKSALPLSLIQPGLQMMLDPLATMAVRTSWGQPAFYNDSERAVAAIDMLLGAGLSTTGVALMLRQGAAVPTISPFGTSWGMGRGTSVSYNVSVADAFQLRQVLEGMQFDTNIRFTELPQEVQMSRYWDRAGQPFGYRQITENEYRVFAGEFGDRYPTMTDAQVGETFFGKGYGRGVWGRGYTEGLAEVSGFRPSLNLESGLGVIGALFGIPSFWITEAWLSRVNMSYMGRPMTEAEHGLTKEALSVVAGFAGSWAGSTLMSSFAPAIEEMIYASAPSIAPYVAGVSGLIGFAGEATMPILMGTWAISEMVGPLTGAQSRELANKYSLDQLAQMYQGAVSKPGGFSGIQEGETLKNALIGAIASKPGGGEVAISLLSFGANLPHDILERYVATNNPDITKYLTPAVYATAFSQTEISAMPDWVRARYYAERNPDWLTTLDPAYGQFSRDPNFARWLYQSRRQELFERRTSALGYAERWYAEPQGVSRYLGPGGGLYSPTELMLNRYNPPAPETIWQNYYSLPGKMQFVPQYVTMPDGSKVPSGTTELKYVIEPTVYREWWQGFDRLTPDQFFREGFTLSGYGAGGWSRTVRGLAHEPIPVGQPYQRTVLSPYDPRTGATVGASESTVTLQHYEYGYALGPGAGLPPDTPLPSNWAMRALEYGITPGMLQGAKIVHGDGGAWVTPRGSSTSTWIEGYVGSKYADIRLEEWGITPGHEQKYLGAWEDGHYTYTTERPTGHSWGWRSFLAGYPIPHRTYHPYQPPTLEEQQTKFYETLAGRNWLYYPSTYEWAKRIGISDLPKSPQGRYGQWWSGYYIEGQDPWTFEKGRYALWADAPSIEDMTSTVESFMISDEVLWLIENTDMMDAIGAEFYRIERETS